MLYVMLHKYKSHRATFDIGPLATLTPNAPPNLELQQLCSPFSLIANFCF